MADLLPASFRGVPFAVRGKGTQVGRRLAVHDYPGRDGCFTEDLGRLGRRYRISGFLVSNSVVYGGGPVLLQQQLLIAAAEAAGPGLLVHPSLGALKVSVEGLSVSDDLGAATTLEIEWSFIEAGRRLFPQLSSSTADAVLGAALAADAICAVAFELASTSALAQGGSPQLAAAAAAGAWTGYVQAAGQDATSVLNLASQLPGAYGRYFPGANAGYLGANASAYGGATVASLVAQAASARAAIAGAATAATTALSTLTPSSLAGAAASGQVLLASLLGACANPADAVRVLARLQGESVSGYAGVSAIGAAIGDLMRRAVVVCAARAAIAYQPSSYDDAISLMDSVVALLEAEITIAGDEGEDDVFAALCALEVAVVQDLKARGANLAPLKGFAVAAALPADVLAQMLYGDAARADQLVQEAAPVHPLFMPTTFRALAS